MRSENWIARESEVLLQTYKRQPVVFESGAGCWLTDTEGKRYLDMVAGVAVMALGHSHPAWVAAVTAQATQLVHTSNLFYTTPMIELAEALTRLSQMSRVFFCNSGCEANEAAIKIARKWGKAKRGDGCFKFVTFDHGFHGRTLGALSATGQKKYCEPFEPLVPGFIQIQIEEHQRLQTLLDGSVCAVIVEPIQGEGGVQVIDPAVLRQIRALCSEREVLLICDEVQTGIARTGKWFGFQHAGVLPDLAPLAKGLGGGFPIGACLAHGEAASTLVPGDHGSTYAGSPLAAQAALSVIRYIEEHGLLAHVLEVGAQLKEALQTLCEEFSFLDHVRGEGLMLAMEFKVPRARGAVAKALAHGLLLNATGDTTLRFVPPLILSAAEVESAAQRLRTTLRELA
jgi:predicted acetylornithine/succinylornithine family transaminase